MFNSRQELPIFKSSKNCLCYLEDLVGPQRPGREHDAKVKVVRRVGPVGGEAPVDDGGVRAAVGVEQQGGREEGGGVAQRVAGGRWEAEAAVSARG